MKIVLISNYKPDAQQSMLRYPEMLRRVLAERGYVVRVVHPPAVLGRRLRKTYKGAAKWIAYIDKYLLAYPWLRWRCRGAELVHICDHSNAMYVPAVAHVTHVITCHDLLAIRSAMGHFAENPVGITGRIFQRLIARGLRQARAILCVSAKTRDDLHEFLHIPGSRLHIVPNALNWPYRPLCRQASEPLLRAVGVAPEEPYFFHLGANHWYKNRGAAITIFAELRKLRKYAGARLVMAGGAMIPELRSIAQENGVLEAIVECVGVDNQQLQALYSCAIATLFPSLEEGFGWPILESQACGCPVVIANRAPMNEIAGGAAILIDLSDAVNAARKIADSLEDPTRLRRHGLRNAASYTTERMLDQCEQLYHELMQISLAHAFTGASQ